jgi:hypothetical protein
MTEESSRAENDQLAVEMITELSLGENKRETFNNSGAGFPAQKSESTFFYGADFPR